MDIICLRNVSINTLHKGDDDDDNNNNNNNNNDDDDGDNNNNNNNNIQRNANLFFSFMTWILIIPTTRADGAVLSGPNIRW